MIKILSILLPHCDDELFILPYIEKKSSEGCLVKVFFLLSSEEKRQKESQKIFSRFKNIVVSYLGNDHFIADGKLKNNSEKIFGALLLNKQIMDSEVIVTPIFEGGHIDHDETFIIGQKLAKKMNKVHLCFSTYNSYHTPLVRVATVYQGMVFGKIEKIHFSFWKGIKYLRQCFHFKSQFVILVVLFPGLVRTFLLKRQIEVLQVERFDISDPHPGKIFYNNDFKKKVQAFLAAKK